MGASEGGCSTTPVSTTGGTVSSIWGLPDASGATLEVVAGMVVGGIVEVDELLGVVDVVGGTVVVVSGTEVVVVSGTVVSTDGCVSGGGGMVVAGTVEEVVEVVVDVDSVVVVSGTVVDGSVDEELVVVGDSPSQDRESKSQRSQSAGTENPVIDLPSLAT